MNAAELLENLTDPQRAAVMHTDGPLLVLAGAGSGKTRVITRRAAYIAATVARPDQILAITFTNKAAGEMRERIIALGAGGSRYGGEMWVCTFHSLCARLLRLYAPTVGLAPNFTILDESDRRSVLKDSIEACGLRTENWAPRMIEKIISDAKNECLWPEHYESGAFDVTSRTAARVYRVYQDTLKRQNACDFDDLLMYTALLLNDDTVRGTLSERFRYLLIDEYQDTNHAQYLIASRLATAHHNICATGDPDQSIYAWRGANIQNILDFESEYPNAKVIRLEQNFRSVGSILAVASNLIRHNEQRKHKELWTDQEMGPSVRVWSCEDERHEAKKIAEDINWLMQEGRAGGDIAIFYRVNAMTRALEDALRDAKIPYQIARGVEFYARKEIKDVIAYLRAIINPADETAILRAINTPARGIGKTTVDKIKLRSIQARVTIDEAINLLVAEGGPIGKKLAPFAELMRVLRALPARPVQAIVEAVLQKSEYENSLLDEEGNEQLANVRELVTAARQYDLDNPTGSLVDWLQQISLMTDADSLQLAGGPVTLMTLHTAKGLEFPVVYIAGLEEDLLPHSRAVRGDPNDIEEERRLCFVGITRARESLTLTNAKYRMTRGITERTIASRFLEELPDDHVERQVFKIERDRSHAHLGGYNETFEQTDPSGYYPGQRVKHEEYGVGEVLQIERRGRSNVIRIHFRAYGERSFALEHVSLYVLDGEC